KGQTIASAVAMMGDWFVVQNNGTPTLAPLSVIAIHQGNAAIQYKVKPFADIPLTTNSPSWSPFSVSTDPDNNMIYCGDSGPGMIAGVRLTTGGLQVAWRAQQRTTEFFTLIGPRGNRTVVSTEIPTGQVPLLNTNDIVVWRDAQTGRE